MPGAAVTEVAPGVHAIQASFDAGPLTQYVVEGRGLALVDSGVSTTPEADVAPFLEDTGASWDDVGWIVATHAHHDHVGGNGAVRALAPDVRIAVHHADRAWAESVEHYLTRLYRTACPDVWRPDAAFEERIRGLWGADALVDLPLGRGDEVDLGEGRRLRVVPTPAHTPGHVCLHDAEHDVLFAGDALQIDGVHMLGGRPWLFPLYSSVEAYVDSLETIAALRPRVVCTAHRGVLGPDELDAALADARAWIGRIDAAVLEAVDAARRIGLAGVVDHLLERWPQYERGLQIHVAAEAHLDQLTRAGTLRPRLVDGTKVWERVDADG